ncbi:MAG: sigma-70 family RNA polymerase sigma factor [Planctomycetes bacterium]|nr:sigma-70 family RNA polymerase sigma factor [Planctomycetota bacterium]
MKQHMKAAYLTALGLVGNREDALELSQEAFFRAYQHYDQLHAQGKFFAWFYQILRNLCFSHLRKRRVRRVRESLTVEDAGQRTEDGGTGDDPGDTGAQFDPEVVAERNESKDRLWRAIGQLDEKHREVIILRHFQNLSYDEMAKLLFCNRGTVTSRLFYTRQRLKEILEGDPRPPVSGWGTRQDSGASDDARVEGVPPSERGQDARDTAIREPRKGGQMP